MTHSFKDKPGMPYPVSEDALSDGDTIDFERKIPELLWESVVRHRDDVLRMAINSQLGCDDWAIASLCGRLELRTLRDGAEIICLDGIELVEFYPPQFEREVVGYQVELRVTRNYRVLTPNLVDNKTDKTGGRKL